LAAGKKLDTGKRKNIEEADIGEFMNRTFEKRQSSAVEERTCYVEAVPRDEHRGDEVHI
jgi:hypothetical protein